MIWFIWFVLFIWLVWFNQINETDQTTQSNQPVLALHVRGSVALAGFFNIVLDRADIPIDREKTA